MTNQNAGGRHVRRDDAEETRRMGEDELLPAGDEAAKTRVYRGAHAGMDIEEARRMDEADKTAVLDYLYDDQPASLAGAYQAPHAESSSETVALSPCGGAANPSARQSEAGYGAFPSQYGRASSDAGKTQVLGTSARSDVSDQAVGDDGGCASEPVHSGASYVKSGPNVQVVGYSKKPVRDFNMPSERGRRARKAQKAREREESAAPESFAQEPAVFGRGAVSGSRKRRRKRRGCLGKLLGALLSIVLVLALICAVPLGLFCHKLDQALALTNEERAAIESELTPAGIGQPFYTLILGSDSREGTTSDTSERSDVIMLIRVDPLGDQVTVVTVPRDTPYRLSDGSLVKINETYNREGPAGIIHAVSEVTGVPISHYAEVGFSDLGSIVDAVGGVTVDVDRELSVGDALTGELVTIGPGTQTLNGQEALAFARARTDYVYDQDAYRQRNDRSLLIAIAKQIMSEPVRSIPETTLDVASYITTDIKSYDLLLAGLPMLVSPGKTTVYTCSGPFAGDINYESGGLWLCYEDPEGWANLMSVVDAGEDPAPVSYEV